jgi:hypothetical protein
MILLCTCVCVCVWLCSGNPWFRSHMGFECYFRSFIYVCHHHWTLDGKFFFGIGQYLFYWFVQGCVWIPQKKKNNQYKVILIWLFHLGQFDLWDVTCKMSGVWKILSWGNRKGKVFVWNGDWNIYFLFSSLLESSLRLIESYSRIIRDLLEWNLESFAISNRVIFFYIRYYERTICLNPQKTFFNFVIVLFVLNYEYRKTILRIINDSTIILFLFLHTIFVLVIFVNRKNRTTSIRFCK